MLTTEVDERVEEGVSLGGSSPVLKKREEDDEEGGEDEDKEEEEEEEEGEGKERALEGEIVKELEVKGLED